MKPLALVLHSHVKTELIAFKILFMNIRVAVRRAIVVNHVKKKLIFVPMNRAKMAQLVIELRPTLNVFVCRDLKVNDARSILMNVNELEKIRAQTMAHVLMALTRLNVIVVKPDLLGHNVLMM